VCGVGEDLVEDPGQRDAASAFGCHDVTLHHSGCGLKLINGVGT
jgi:hypothetical protein